MPSKAHRMKFPAYLYLHGPSDSYKNVAFSQGFRMTMVKAKEGKEEITEIVCRTLFEVYGLPAILSSSSIESGRTINFPRCLCDVLVF